MFINHEGRREAKRQPTRKAAQDLANRIAVELGEGDRSAFDAPAPPPAAAPLFGAYADAWLSALRLTR